VPAEIVQFILKLLLKRRILAEHHDFHWLLVATKLLTAKLHSCYVKESELASEISEARNRTFCLWLRNPGYITIENRQHKAGKIKIKMHNNVHYTKFVSPKFSSKLGPCWTVSRHSHTNLVFQTNVFLIPVVINNKRSSGIHGKTSDCFFRICSCWVTFLAVTTRWIVSTCDCYLFVDSLMLRALIVKKTTRSAYSNKWRHTKTIKNINV